MTTLAQGSSVTVSVRDGGTVAIATNGGAGSAVVSPTEGGTTNVSFGPAPERRVLGPYAEGASIVITNQSSGAFDYDVETKFDPNNVSIGGGVISGAAITGGSIGGAGVSADSGLQAWALAQAFRVVSATRNSDGAVTTASIVWPDGTTGTYAADILSVDFPGFTDAWHATYDSTPAKTITQPAVTRDSSGNVTVQPAITIA